MTKTVHKLKVKLALEPLPTGGCEATVTVTTTDSCYKEGALKIGLPPGMAGIPEIEYLSFYFTHEGKICGQIVRDVSKSIKIPPSPGKREVTAFVVVNGEVAGQDSKPFPHK